MCPWIGELRLEWLGGIRSTLWLTEWWRYSQWSEVKTETTSGCNFLLWWGHENVEVEIITSTSLRRSISWRLYREMDRLFFFLLLWNVFTTSPGACFFASSSLISCRSQWDKEIRGLWSKELNCIDSSLIYHCPSNDNEVSTTVVLSFTFFARAISDSSSFISSYRVSNRMEWAFRSLYFLSLLSVRAIWSSWSCSALSSLS